MTVTILEHAKVEPTYAIGGLRVDTGTNAGTGAGVWFVTESDESDGSFLHLQPTIAVVTNVENDHLSSDDELPGLLAQFSTFVQRVPPDGCAIIGLDDRGSAFIAKNATVPKTTFAIRTDADVMARDIVYDGLGSRFTLVERGNALGTVHLHMPGEINVLNALAAIAVARTLKVDVPTIVTPPCSPTTTRTIRRRSRKRSRRRAAIPANRSWWRFSRTAIRARVILLPILRPRSRMPMRSCSRRSTRRPKRRSKV
jgi:UDP-N-acetylmuramate--alanine ligase